MGDHPPDGTRGCAGWNQEEGQLMALDRAQDDADERDQAADRRQRAAGQDD
jgi:hypothetical protein